MSSHSDRPDHEPGQPPGARRARSHRAPTRGWRRHRWVVLLSVVALVLVGVDVGRHWSHIGNAAGSFTGIVKSSASSSPSPAGEAGPKPTDSASPGGKPSASPTVVVQGAGTFTVAPGGTGVVGSGTVYRYAVVVENGIGQDAVSFAREVDSTLDDRRSWTSGGNVGFQRTDQNQAAFQIYLASPKTVDQLCAPLQTDGFTSCRMGDKVVINVARWLEAVPEFDGHLADYRHYVINHEVGHRVGHGHELCPGVGKRAPVMQQQTLGLKGCKLNPWPYVDGQLVTGPATSAE